MTQSGSAYLSVELEGARGVRRAIVRSPAVAILGISVAIAIPLVALSVFDVGGMRATWDNLQWIETAIGAALAAAASVRGSTGRVRRIRMAGTVALALAVGANVSWAWLNLTGQAAVPSISDVFVVAILAFWLFTIPASVRGRLTSAEASAVYIDAAMIACLLATLLFIVHGPTALSLPGGAGVLALAYPVGFIGLGAAGMVALLAARYPFTLRGQLAMIAGVTMIGLAYLGCVAPAVEGSDAGPLPGILFTVGVLVAGYGVVTWQDEPNDSPGYVGVSRFVSRAIGPTVAGLVFMTLLVPVEAGIHMFVDTAVFVAGGLFLTRQALLLRERTTMLDEVTRLKVENERLVDELRRELADHALDQRRMIQASRAAAVGDLAAGVAHEVNNPLAVVLLSAELLLSDLDADDPRREDLDAIRTQALRARTIIRALGEFAQPTEPARTATALADLVKRAVDLVRYQIGRRGVTIDERYDALPDLLVDPQAIQQAVINVLNNATLAVADHGRIEVAVSVEAGDAIIAITDDGVGMTDTTMSRAFEPFFTGREFETDDALATGLGLAVTRGLIEAHGGTITLSSHPGRGTRVELRLPVDRATAEDEGDEPERGIR